MLWILVQGLATSLSKGVVVKSHPNWLTICCPIAALLIIGNEAMVCDYRIRLRLQNRMWFACTRRSSLGSVSSTWAMSGDCFLMTQTKSSPRA